MVAGLSKTLLTSEDIIALMERGSAETRTARYRKREFEKFELIATGEVRMHYRKGHDFVSPWNQRRRCLTLRQAFEPIGLAKVEERPIRQEETNFRDA